jgi:hypothetical protein
MAVSCAPSAGVLFSLVCGQGDPLWWMCRGLAVVCARPLWWCAWRWCLAVVSQAVVGLWLVLLFCVSQGR